MGTTKKNEGDNLKVKASFNISIKAMVTTAVVILMASALAWFCLIYNSSDRVFWGMINSNLSATTFTQKLSQTSGSQEVSQINETNTTQPRLVNGASTITQAPSTNVTTQTIGTPSEDYVRYTAIQTGLKNAEGNLVDYSSVKNEWGKSATLGASSTDGQAYQQIVFGIFPLGYAAPELRAGLVKEIKDTKVYTIVDKASVHRNGIFGRPTYTYNVSVDVYNYIKALKSYGSKVGLRQLESIDPEQYSSESPITATVTVDGWSHQLTRISYSEGMRIEDYVAYGSQKKLQTAPEKYVSVEELQARLQMLQ